MQVKLRKWEKPLLLAQVIKHRSDDTFTPTLKTRQNQKALQKSAFKAIENRYVGKVGRALAQGLDAESCNEAGYSLLTWAVKHRAWVPLVLALVQPKVPLEGGIFKLGSIQGVDVNKPDARGYTALHEAAMNGDTIESEILLRAGADPYIKTPDGMDFFELLYSAPRYGGKFPSNGLLAVDTAEVEDLKQWYDTLAMRFAVNSAFDEMDWDADGEA